MGLNNFIITVIIKQDIKVYNNQKDQIKEQDKFIMVIHIMLLLIIVLKNQKKKFRDEKLQYYNT